MDIRKIKKLIELLEESGIAELEIKEGEESVRISRQTSTIVQSVAPVAAPMMAAPVLRRPRPVLHPPLCQRRWLTTQWSPGQIANGRYLLRSRFADFGPFRHSRAGRLMLVIRFASSRR